MARLLARRLSCFIEPRRSSGRLAKVDIFDVDVDPLNLHADHVFYGAGNLGLHGAAHLAGIRLIRQDEIQIDGDRIIFDFDPDSLGDTAAEYAIHPTGNIGHAHYTRDGQCGQSGDREQDPGSDCRCTFVRSSRIALLIHRNLPSRRTTPPESMPAGGSQEHQAIAMPPSTLSTCPVMYPAWSEARKATALAISEVSPLRPSGINPTIPSLRFSGTVSQISVSIYPAATALTVILREATSRASDLVKPIWPALEAE